MRHRPPLFLAACGALLLSIAALADAPSDQYTPFAKDRQDIFDAKTRLRWARYAVISVGSVDAAEAECAKGGFGDAGVGWRVPTVKELLTLVDEDPHNESLPDGAVAQRAIDRNAFPGTPVDHPYLTAVRVGATGTWVVDFRDGHASFGPLTGTYYVRCVIAE